MDEWRKELHIKGYKNIDYDVPLNGRGIRSEKDVLRSFCNERLGRRRMS